MFGFIITNTPETVKTLQPVSMSCSCAQHQLQAKHGSPSFTA